jgi:alpha-ketoglutaric semialdehyde dehydrogenase
MLYGGEVGARLVQASGIKAVGFTASLKGGRALCALAAARSEPIPVFTEMSSVNPFILLPQALLARGARIAEELTASVSTGCGQLCTSPSLLLGIRSPVFSEFIGQLRNAMVAQPPQTILTASTLANYRAGVKRIRDMPGIDMLAGGDDVGNQAVPPTSSRLTQRSCFTQIRPWKKRYLAQQRSWLNLPAEGSNWNFPLACMGSSLRPC